MNFLRKKTAIFVINDLFLLIKTYIPKEVVNASKDEEQEEEGNNEESDSEDDETIARIISQMNKEKDKEAGIQRYIYLSILSIYILCKTYDAYLQKIYESYERGSPIFYMPLKLSVFDAFSLGTIHITITTLRWKKRCTHVCALVFVFACIIIILITSLYNKIIKRINFWAFLE